ncbi:granule-bound starch synthase 1, chloroplastic/amyloplastic isoform X1 [Solanum tuberosum]|nr:PREDICTED: granule-bound starch synthase 1, chloroplastic/amyloplastic isoform X1 [Solanum tuberosum]XP_015162569.1 PREDICTED: granule-bound starch synthase 1, chloroplastic/amyloplastic isoform X1 [Solanum tuberosum]XP_015162570.1 PREDICTED: granule-bound starch synthase 1, chloroplastic/amyloplastic isoform X1 [Solanum tuberosum]XP_015162571.1 PREDICTED: granule-bound starch synthase 1, chloroplastic/amyloplastic isoform X1 [Solanum tuberosum]
MASITASHHFVSRSQTSLDTKSTLSQIGLRNHTLTHNGLRAVNKLDGLQSRTNTKVTPKMASRTETKRPGCSATIVCGKGMNLIFVGTEVGPWSKTGGLGDVLGGLPPALAARGHRVMTISPRYDQYKDAWDTSVAVEVHLPILIRYNIVPLHFLIQECDPLLYLQVKVGDSIEIVRFFHCYKRGVDRVFVDHPMFLEKVWGKTGSKIYGPKAGLDYLDNELRFSLLCQAALEAPKVLNLNSSNYFSGPYGEDVLFIANDWHTALIPCYLKSMYQSRGIYLNAKVAFCIHNIAYQGRFSFSDFPLLNLPDEFRGSFDFIDGYEKPVKGRKINWMKAGILESHRVVTVSPYYAQELVSAVDKGVELDSVLRKTCITGIVNGMDTQEWNPATDKYTDVKYDITTVMDAKPLLKEALQAAVGLPVDKKIPLIGFIGRLEEQKGSDILVAAIHKFIGLDVQIVVLGTGKKEFEQEIEQLEVLYPNKAKGVAKFNVPLAHMITAGADFMLVPSRFEPCGLIQLHAMRYGTVPICASTGGLVDTVKEGYTGFHMGAFNVECDVVDPADVLKIVTTVARALAVYGTLAFAEMIKNCMSEELSWKEPAKKWETLLLGLGASGSEPGVEGEEIAPLAKENVATP